jgi:F-type H+-transporting ATPase subunit delta
VAAAFEQVPDLQRVLVVPTVPPETKTSILDAVLDSLDVSDTIRRFIHVVQRHYRTAHLADIADTFREVVDREQGRARAHVESAAPLDDDEKAELVRAMERLSGSTVVAEFEQNPELLGGFRIRVGSKIFDGSLDAQLDRLSRETRLEQG